MKQIHVIYCTLIYFITENNYVQMTCYGKFLLRPCIRFKGKKKEEEIDKIRLKLKINLRSKIKKQSKPKS